MAGWWERLDVDGGFEIVDIMCGCPVWVAIVQISG
jgi:hypothetical protein